MIKTVFLVTSLALSPALLAAPPHAQQEKVEGNAMVPDPKPVEPRKPFLPPNCKYYSEMTDHLSKKYGEHSLFSGIQKGGQTLRDIFINIDTGSYSDVVITPKKHGLVACIVSSGTAATVHDAIKPHTI